MPVIVLYWMLPPWMFNVPAVYTPAPRSAVLALLDLPTRPLELKVPPEATYTPPPLRVAVFLMISLLAFVVKVPPFT